MLLVISYRISEIAGLDVESGYNKIHKRLPNKPIQPIATLRLISTQGKRGQRFYIIENMR